MFLLHFHTLLVKNFGNPFLVNSERHWAPWNSVQEKGLNVLHVHFWRISFSFRFRAFDGVRQTAGNVSVKKQMHVINRACRRTDTHVNIDTCFTKIKITMRYMYFKKRVE